MTKQFLIFFFSISIIASCKCGDKKVGQVASSETTTTSSSSDNGSVNLAQMSAEVSGNTAINTTPTDPGEEQMNRMYSTGDAATQARNARNEMRKSGKLTKGYYPEGSERILTGKDIQFLTSWGHDVMLNEIYARHGMIFKDDALKKHFEAQSWYHPVSANIYQSLNPVEKQNITFLLNTSKDNNNKQDGLASN